MPFLIPPRLLPVVACLATLVLSSCAREPAPVPPRPHAPAADVAPPADVFERDAHKIVGISYPPNLARYPGLARRLVAHAGARRAVLAAALARHPDPSTPLELTLRFVTVADTPEIFAVSAEEELYLGGPTSRPGSTTFLWLPGAQRLLMPDEIIPDPGTWARIHDYMRKRQQEESATLSSGVEPTRGMRHDFSPRVNSAGRIVGLRFRTEDGTEVEVPASMLKPLVAPAFAAWFDDTPTGATPAPTG